VVFDGRIDNRAELIRGIGRPYRDEHSGTDMELVLRAYFLWGTIVPARILGDFAFAIWDPRRYALYLCA
jgi:asparagine synthase (glutamine-hydrolysing)